MGRLLCVLFLVCFTASPARGQVRRVTPVVQGYVGSYWLPEEPLPRAYVLLGLGDDVRCRRAIAVTCTDSAGRFTLPAVEVPPLPASAQAKWAVCLPLPSDTTPTDTTRLRPTLFIGHQSRIISDTVRLDCWAHMGTCKTARQE